MDSNFHIYFDRHWVYCVVNFRGQVKKYNCKGVQYSFEHYIYDTVINIDISVNVGKWNFWTIENQSQGNSFEKDEEIISKKKSKCKKSSRFI